jgi:hypothetical protein
VLQAVWPEEWQAQLVLVARLLALVLALLLLLEAFVVCCMGG